jgi:hypothetical protein
MISDFIGKEKVTGHMREVNVTTEADIGIMQAQAMVHLMSAGEGRFSASVFRENMASRAVREKVCCFKVLNPS